MLLNGNNYPEILTITRTKEEKTFDYVKCYDIDINALNDCEAAIASHPSYGKDDRLLSTVMSTYPDNSDVRIVAMKIALIDVTNSTHLSQHKDKVPISDLASFITSINFDARVRGYDPDLVYEIANFNGKINLFSFASKYCHLHNRHIYGNDDYPKYDGIIARCLPVYLGIPKYSIGRKITPASLENIRINKEYDKFKGIIDDFIARLGLSSTKGIRKMIDHFIWYTNR